MDIDTKAQKCFQNLGDGYTASFTGSYEIVRYVAVAILEGALDLAWTLDLQIRRSNHTHDGGQSYRHAPGAPIWFCGDLFKQSLPYMTSCLSAVFMS